MSSTRDKEEERRKKIFGSESAHWYQHDGQPLHDVPKATRKKGDDPTYRPTTLTDARKLNLLPSVTSLLSKYSNKAGIDKWKRGLLLDCITREEHLTLSLKTCTGLERDEVFRSINERAEALASQAAELGTLSHTGLEIGCEMIRAGSGSVVINRELYNKLSDAKDPSRLAYCLGVVLDKMKACQMIGTGSNITQEKSLVFNIIAGDLPFGLGGKVDLIIEYSTDEILNLGYPETLFNIEEREQIWSRALNGYPLRVLYDFKTRGPSRLKSGVVKFPQYSSDIAQMAGYSEGMKFALGVKPDACCNILIASDALTKKDVAPHIEFRTYTPEEMIYGRTLIESAAQMWMAEESIESLRTGKPCYRPELSE